MPWTTSNRRATLPKDWHRRRAIAKRNAAGQCQATEPNGQRCQRPGTDCDHIVRGAGDDPTNLQWLCSAHHKAKTQREAAAAKPSRRRPAERHPGLI